MIRSVIALAIGGAALLGAHHLFLSSSTAATEFIHEVNGMATTMDNLTKTHSNHFARV